MTIWETIASPVLKIIDKIVPDRAAAQVAKDNFTAMMGQGALTAELEQLKAITSAQSEINKVEAASTNWFVAGSRPFIMWICGLALFSDFLLRPYVGAFSHAAIPALDMNELMPLLFGMLGLGAYRTVEKVRGVADKH